MADRNSQVGWSEAQWNRVRQTVQEEAQRARVAASFLPIHGPLPASTEVVPSELLDPSGTVHGIAVPQGPITDLVGRHHIRALQDARDASEQLADAADAASDAAATVAAAEAAAAAAAGAPDPQAVTAAREAAATALTLQRVRLRQFADALEQLSSAPGRQGRLLGVVSDAVARLVEASGLVSLTDQQIKEDDLSSALNLFARATNRVVRLEDWAIFNGQVRPGGAQGGHDHLPSERTFGFNFRPGEKPTGYEDHAQVVQRLATTNPGGLGLLGAAGDERVIALTAAPAASGARATGAARADARISSDVLAAEIIDSTARLERQGFYAPFVCVLSREPFVEMHRPARDSMVMPSDRIEPLLKHPLVHAGVLDDRHWEQGTPYGIVLSLSGNTIDLVMAVDLTVDFVRVDDQGKYVFRVYERFTPRVKDPAAIVRLAFR